MLGNNQFENFIIKKIVTGVFYDTSTLSLCFNKVVASERMLEEIYAEAQNYGYSEEEITITIDSAIRRITHTTHKENVYSNINLSRLAIGQHIRIVMWEPSYGEMSLELLNLAKNLFLVLSSDDNSLLKDDELISCSDVWNVNSCIEFAVLRNQVRFPNNSTIYKTSPVLYWEFIYPSSIYEVYDSESDFRFTEQQEEVDDNNVQQMIVFSWYPSIESPIVAFEDLGMSVDNNAPYIIMPDSKGNIATFYLNMDWLSISQYHLDEFVENQRSRLTYELENEQDESMKISQLKVIRPGTLRRTLDVEIGKYIWIIKEKMLLKANY